MVKAQACMRLIQKSDIRWKNSTLVVQVLIKPYLMALHGSWLGGIGMIGHEMCYHVFVPAVKGRNRIAAD